MEIKLNFYFNKPFSIDGKKLVTYGSNYFSNFYLKRSFSADLPAG